MSYTKPLQLLHVDLYGPISVESLGCKKYILALVDDSSRYTWVEFVRKKSDVPIVLINLLRKIQVHYECTIKMLRSDNGKEFKNSITESYLSTERVAQNLSAPYTQKNGVVERINRTLVEGARPMLNASGLPTNFLAEAISTACFTQNRSLVVKRHEKTPYHILHGRNPNIKYFHVFGFTCYVLDDRDHLGKFSPKVDETKFIG